jgi:hypothetical protein
MVAVPQQQQTLKASAGSAHIAVSGGVFTQQFIEALMQPAASHAAVQAETFALPWQFAPNPRALDEQIALMFELICEQWDRVREQPEKMTPTQVRERWLRPLFEALEFRWVYQRGDTVLGEDDDLRFDLSHRGWSEKESPERAPVIHTVAPAQGLDERVAGRRGIKAKSPHDMVQAFLNASHDDRWAIVTNGRVLRLLHKHYQIYSKGYVEFDLESICEARASADWRALYRLLHASRFWTRPGEEKCPLDRLNEESVAAGVKVGEQLQGNVRRAIQHLATGFLDAATLARLREHEQETRAFYAEVLHVVYRILFLLYAEQRGMLPKRDSLSPLYRQEYSLARLAERVSRSFPATDGHVDLWEGLKATFQMVAVGVPALGIFGYNGELFSAEKTPTLHRLTCRNGALLQAIRALTFVQREGGLQRVNYADVGVEEIGAVYESLLEYVPRVTSQAEVVDGESVPANSFYLDPRGTSRKTTGSYYTRPELVAELVKTALAPVLAERLARAGADPKAREAALLALRVVDPACGSAAFLIAATNYLGQELARIRTNDDYPADHALRVARRDVLTRCIYGVDLNPMAVELAKVSLWITSAVEDLPLNFLDHHIKCGNSLIGATPDLLEDGVPDEAFEPVTGDDKAIARSLKRRNKEQRELFAQGKYQAMLPFELQDPKLGNLAVDYQRLVALPEETPEQVHAKRRFYEDLRRKLGYESSGQFYADAWCSAFFWPADDDHAHDAPTCGEVRRIEQSPFAASVFLREEVRRVAQEQRFFHWHIEFPEVFSRSDPGFDCVLGNPPWEQVELKEEEFFAPRAPDVVSGGTGAERKRRIEELAKSKPELYKQFELARLKYDRERKFLQNSGRYPLTGRGRTNLYSVFAETDCTLIARSGRLGVILPWGISTDDTNKDFFSSIIHRSGLASAYLYANERKLFAGTHHFFRFALFTFTGSGIRTQAADLAAHLWLVEDMAEEARHFTLSPEDFSLINPNTRTLPIFRSKHDASLTKKLYRAAPVLVNESRDKSDSPWGVTFRQGLFNMTSDSHLFRTRAQLEMDEFKLDGAGIFRQAGQEGYVPLLESKLFHQFDHRFATFEGGPSEDKARDTTEKEHFDPSYIPMPHFWVPRAVVESLLKEKGWNHPWLLVYRRISNATNERSFISTIVPRFGAGDPAPVMLISEGNTNHCLALVANLNALPYDYVVRQKVGGTHLDFFLVKQLPVLPPETYQRRIGDETLAEWVTKRALELTYTSHDMQPLARDLGYGGPPFAWNEARRARLRGELDGLYAHLYGLSRGDLEYVLETFPVLKKNEERQHGEYRSARLALAAYDLLAPEMAGVSALRTPGVSPGH